MDWLHIRLENHWLACMAAAGGGGRVTRLGGGLVIVNPHVSGSAFNFITLRQAGEERLEQILGAGSALLAEEGRPPALFLSPAAGEMPAVEVLLTKRGWLRRTRQVVLVRDLPLTDAPAVPEPISVDSVGEDTLDLWADTLLAAFEVEPRSGGEIRAAWTNLFHSPGEGCWAHFCLARLHGEAVGTGLTWSQGEIAGLYCGAVLPAARRQGVERATVIHRLGAAASAGARIATLQTEAGSPVEHLCVNRLGFRVAYDRSLWVPRKYALASM